MTGEPTGTLSDAQMDALASLDAETIRAIGEAVNDAGGSGGMSRRQMLGVLTGLGGAGLATGYASREVAAQPTGDEGQVGQQGDRVEAWVSELDANEIRTDAIANFSQGHDYLIWRDEDYIYAIDHDGTVVYGGPDAVGVTDPTDFSEMLQAAVTNSDQNHPSIRVGPNGYDSANDNAQQYVVKSTATLDTAFTLIGAGKNSTHIIAESSMTGNRAIEVLPTRNPAIFRFDSIKFGGFSTPEPSHWVYADGATELILSDVEFRDAGSWGIEAVNTNAYNYIRDSWFLSGAGFKVGGDRELQISGCKIVANSQVDDFDHVVATGNWVADGVGLTRNAIGKFTGGGNDGLENRMDNFQVNGDLANSVQNPTVLIELVNNLYGSIYVQNSAQVTADNSSTALSEFRVDGGGAREGIIAVCGTDTADVNNTFTDLLAQTGGDSFTTISNTGTAGARNYSYSSGVLSVAIDGAGETMNVGLQFLGGRIQ